MRVGVDLIEIERVRRALARYARFRERCFTEAERAYCDSRRNPAESYAGRFAGKEAVGKALGFGVARAFAWQEIEIAGRPKPSVRLSGRLAERAVRHEVVTFAGGHELQAAGGAVRPLLFRQRGQRVGGMAEFVIDTGEDLQRPDDIEHLRALEGEHDDGAGFGVSGHGERLGARGRGRKDNHPTFPAMCGFYLPRRTPRLLKAAART